MCIKGPIYLANAQLCYGISSTISLLLLMILNLSLNIKRSVNPLFLLLNYIINYEIS